MTHVRIIARLDIKGPNLIKGVHLEGLRVVGDPNAKVRAAAARTLGLMAAAPAVPKLEAALNDKEPAVER